MLYYLFNNSHINEETTSRNWLLQSSIVPGRRYARLFTSSIMDW